MPGASYRLLGELWQVPLALDAERVDSQSEPDVRVEVSTDEGARRSPTPPESSWLAGAVEEGTGYALFREGGVTTSWYPGLGRAHYSSDRGTVTIRAERGTEATWALLSAASIPAQRALLSGDLCLHASAFDVDGSAVALVGSSGSGKSTLAALAVERGFEPLSDDAVRVGWRAGAPELVGGSSSLRLRSGASVLARGESWNPTVDGRISRRIGTPASRPLSLVVVLRPDASELCVEELSPASALRLLVAVGDRVLSVRDPELLTMRLAQWAKLVRACPVVELSFPRQGTLENLGKTFDVLERALVGRGSSRA